MTWTDPGRSQLTFVGTQNAQAFSYFLLQHKATLGNLYISQVRVFRDNRKEPEPNLLFVVEPVPASNDTKTFTEPYEDIPSMFVRMKRHHGAADTVEAAAKSPEDLPAPAPLIVMPKPVPDLFSKDPQPTYLDLYQSAEDTKWDKAKCKGATFVSAMRGSDSEAGKIFKPPRDSAAGLYDENHLGKWDSEGSWRSLLRQVHFLWSSEPVFGCKRRAENTDYLPFSEDPGRRNENADWEQMT